MPHFLPNFGFSEKDKETSQIPSVDDRQTVSQGGVAFRLPVCENHVQTDDAERFAGSLLDNRPRVQAGGVPSGSMQFSLWAQDTYYY
jgi:hypothetical protein